jgi:hypothetical protein
MKVGNSVTDSELPKLQQLASEFLAVAAPELSILDQMASLAAGIAARWREAAHRQLLEQVTEGARTVFPTATEILRVRLAQSTFDELSQLGALLDTAVASAAAFAQADSGLRAAHDRGDYTAMPPLAIEAAAQKEVLSTASAELADRLGIADSAARPAPGAERDRGDAALPADASLPEEPAEPLLTLTDADEDALTLEDQPSGPIEANRRADSQPERRRLRALIRQMRPVAEEP